MNVFDCNIHLTNTDRFKDYKRNIPCTYSSYCSSYSEPYKLKGCLHSGLPNLENYSYKSFQNKSSTINTDSYSFPAITSRYIDDSLVEELICFRKNLHKGCKLHPRLLNLDYNIDYLSKLASLVSENNLYLMICTYIDNKNINSHMDIDNLRRFLDLIITNFNSLNIILAHGGGSYFNLFKEYTFHSNFLLDLSFTYMRYVNTQIEEEIVDTILDNNLRLAFGTDWPDYSFSDHIPILNKHRELIKNDKFFQNFLYNNAYNFLNKSAN